MELRKILIEVDFVNKMVTADTEVETYTSGAYAPRRNKKTNLDDELQNTKATCCGGGSPSTPRGATSYSSYDFQIHLNGGFKFHYKYDYPFANWIDHDELNYERYVFNELELKLIDIETGDSAPGVQAMERQKGDGSWW